MEKERFKAWLKEEQQPGPQVVHPKVPHYQEAVMLAAVLTTALRQRSGSGIPLPLPYLQ